jgi:predicted DCC family thiol-disulfide oxidoreductase YuxK
MRSVLLYDAECRFCRFAARVVDRVDRDEELAIMPLQDPRAAPLLDCLPEDERLSSWRIARNDGRLAGFGAGVVPLLAAMRRTRPLARVASHLPAHLLDAAYALVARNRRTLGKLVPDVPPVVARRDDQIAATSRASDSTDSGRPDARATSRSQRTDSPGA